MLLKLRIDKIWRLPGMSVLGSMIEVRMYILSIHWDLSNKVVFKVGLQSTVWIFTSVKSVPTGMGHNSEIYSEIQIQSKRWESIRQQSKSSVKGPGFDHSRSSGNSVVQVNLQALPPKSQLLQVVVFQNGISLFFRVLRNGFSVFSPTRWYKTQWVVVSDLTRRLKKNRLRHRTLRTGMYCKIVLPSRTGLPWDSTRLFLGTIRVLELSSQTQKKISFSNKIMRRLVNFRTKKDKALRCNEGFSVNQTVLNGYSQIPLALSELLIQRAVREAL